ncbi:MAG: tetratricopeptide repeat protein [Oscillospiraceae bacterium]|nr:tetratricopeptide repeat protein [Oscillospiraceae bacterium]
MANNYDVFLSYRHKPLDGEITQKTFNFLERYKLPKSLLEQGARPIRRVFRDTEELAVSRILTHTIDEALRSADYLVIICSPYTPESEWVDREVMTFTEMGKADHIFPLLVSGSPEQSFTRTLKTIPDIMDRVMDVRCEGDDPKQIMKKAQSELLRVAAAVAGVSADRMRKADRMRSSRRIVTRGVTAAAVFAAVALGSAGLWNQAAQFRQQAREAQEASMTILQELTYDLPSHLADLPGTYARLADLLQTNADQITDILELNGSEPSVRYEIGANYSKLATAYGTIGHLEDAETAIRRAIHEYEASNDGSDRSRRYLAEAHNDLGSVLSSAGRYNEAETEFSHALVLQGAVADGEAALAQYTANLGIDLLAQGKTDEGTDTLARALALVPPEGWASPGNAALALRQYASGLQQQFRFDEAEEACSQSIALLERTLEPGQVNAELLKAMLQLASCRSDAGHYDQALQFYSKLLPLAEAFAESDSENRLHQEMYAEALNDCAYVQNLQGDLSGAAGHYLQAAAIYKALSDRSGAAPDIANYSIAAINAADNEFTAGNYARSSLLFRAGLKSYAAVCEELGDFHTASYLSYRAFTRLVFENDVYGAEQDAWDALQMYSSVLTYGYCGTMCMYAGDLDLADELFTTLAQAGAAEPVKQLFDALSAYGMPHEHMPAVLDIISTYENLSSD